MLDLSPLRRARSSLFVLVAVMLLVATVAAGDSGSRSGNYGLDTAVRPVSGGATDEGAPSAPGAPGAPVRPSAVPPVGSPGGRHATDAGTDGPTIASVSPQIASAGTNTTITISGTGFGTKASRLSLADVGFVGADGVYWASGWNDPEANVDDIVNWSDTEILVRVPTGVTSGGDADSASSGIVWIVTDANQASNAVPFAVTFGVMRMRWVEPPVFAVNDNCPGVAGGAEAVRRAAATWNTALPNDFRIDCSGDTTSTAVENDGVSAIAWGSPGETTLWYVPENGTIVEADIILDAETNWTTGTAEGSVYSVEALALQAIGYGLGISLLSGEEVQGPSDIGKACSLWRGDSLGNMNLVALSPADRAAAAYLYGGGPANPPLLAAAFTADTIAGPAPLTVRFADASLGGATSWSWDFGDNETSNERSPSHTYDVPGEYTVELTASAPGYPDDTIRALDRIAVTAPAASAVPGGAGVPTDTDGDGACDDVNGNGRRDFADVVLYFNSMGWIAANEPVALFDFNANGRIDFADVVWLFNSL